MDEIRQDLERYGVRTETWGYICPGCEVTYPSLYWFHHSLIDHRVLCEQCVSKTQSPGTYQEIVEIGKADEITVDWEGLSSQPWFQYAQDAAIVLVVLVIVSQIEQATGKSLHEMAPGLSLLGEVITILFGWLVVIVVAAGVVWWFRRRRHPEESNHPPQSHQ